MCYRTTRGRIRLPRITPTMLTKFAGEDASFTCELSSSGAIDWYTEPPTFLPRYIVNGTTFTILNTQEQSDDGKVIVCRTTIGRAVAEDRAHLTVNPSPPTMTPTAKLPTTSKTTLNASPRTA